MWFNVISPHSLCEIVFFCSKGNGVWFSGNDPTALPQNNSAGKWWGNVIKQTVVYEKLLVPSGIVECVNHCVEQKWFVIMETSKQLSKLMFCLVGSCALCEFENIQHVVSLWHLGCRFYFPCLVDTSGISYHKRLFRHPENWISLLKWGRWELSICGQQSWTKQIFCFCLKWLK